MPSSRTLLIAIVALCATNVDSFGIAPVLKPFGVSAMKSSTVLYPIRCSDKYYQLEEMEDKDTCTTELFLKPDGVIEFGDTDGPQPIASEGRWSVPEGTNDYTMTIKRSFEAGKGNSDIGEFNYDLNKTYQGEMTKVGDSVAVTGVMSAPNTASEQDLEVGYFNMIDATEERKGDDKKV